MMVRRLMAGFGGALRVRNAAEEGQQQPPGACVELVFRAERDVGPVATGVGARPVHVGVLCAWMSALVCSVC
eukprot:1141541-Pelagomonas_calceolata.AAC.2